MSGPSRSYLGRADEPSAGSGSVSHYRRRPGKLAACRSPHPRRADPGGRRQPRHGTGILAKLGLTASARVLAQSSKRGAIPRDYVAIVGDSYALGAGDWLVEVRRRLRRSGQRWANPGFGSQHALRESLGRDVVSLGRAGAGNLSGWLAHPVSWIRFTHGSLLCRAGPPDLIVAYFYAGNDLGDNLGELRRWGRSEASLPRDLDRASRRILRRQVRRDGAPGPPSSRCRDSSSTASSRGRRLGSGPSRRRRASRDWSAAAARSPWQDRSSLPGSDWRRTSWRSLSP